LRENGPMLRLTKGLGFSEPESVENDVVRVTLGLR
jgi:hypothetical protein